MKYLITGIEGFVGGYLFDELKGEGNEIFGTYFADDLIDAAVLDGCSLYKADVTNKAQLERIINEIQPDVLFHLAAQSSAYVSWKNPQLTMNINIIGLVNLLEVLKDSEKKCRLVLIGSSEEYGIVKEEENPISEQQPLRPGNPYSVSKITCEELAKLYVSAYNMDIVMTRSFNHIGNRQSKIFVMPDFASRVAKISKGEMESVMLVGNLEAKRDFSDVRDVVSAYRVIAEKGQSGEVYNVGSGKSNSIKHYLEYMISKEDIEVKIEQDPDRMRPSDNPVIVCDNTKLKKLGWKPKFDIYNTIDNMLEYFKKE